MPMHNLIEHSDNCSKTLGRLWQYYRDTLGEADDAAITDSGSSKSKVRITGKTPS